MAQALLLVSLKIVLVSQILFLLICEHHTNLKLLGFRSNIFINIYNIFDIRNEINVWNDTGRATYTLSANDVSLTNPERIGNLNEHLLKPEWYSEPRKIDIGLNISF